MPVVTMIGGPNGSGKSSLVDLLLNRGANLGEHLNADAMARSIGGDPRTANLAAQAEVRRRRAVALAEGRDYSWETVMSHESHIEHLGEAKLRGYEVRLMYVAIENPFVNVLRVRDRVAQGGHDVPVPAILGRYHKSLANLSAAVVVSDLAKIFDNSHAFDPLRLVATYQQRWLFLHLNPVPDWFVAPADDILRFMSPS